MLETLIAKVGFPVLVNVLSEALGQVDNPLTKGASDALKKVDEALRTGGVSPQEMEDAHRHAEKMAELRVQEYQAALGAVNETMRAEIVSEDQYVRRMRPTFGYLMAITWAAQMFGLAYVIVFETDKAGEVLNAMSNLSAIWAVGLSVLGVYVYKRSQEKKHKKQPETIFWNSMKK